MVEVGAFVRQQGVQIYLLLDDWLLVHMDRGVLLLVPEMGLLVNFQSGSLSSTFHIWGRRYF